jgi:hypothetical protein
MKIQNLYLFIFVSVVTILWIIFQQQPEIYHMNTRFRASHETPAYMLRTNIFMFIAYIIKAIIQIYSYIFVGY